MSALIASGSTMKFAAIGAATSVAVVPVTDWIHQVAGPAGDLAVVVTAAALVSALARKMWLATKVAWDGIDEIRDNTRDVPLIRDELAAHIQDTRERFAAIEEATAVIERRRVRATDFRQ